MRWIALSYTSRRRSARPPWESPRGVIPRAGNAGRRTGTTDHRPIVRPAAPIADPTAYVAEGSELDKEAAQRAFTVYMPGRNVPMIPRTLSDELCSLKEGEERNTLCARLP